MASQEDVSRVAKILARATSSESNEANVALHSAYKRMRRDQVGIKQLLTLPLEELYQEALVKLVSLILENQNDLSPLERRKAFENYMFLITVRFSKGEFDNLEHINSPKQAEENFRQAQQEKSRREDDKAWQEDARHREEKARSTASAQAKEQQRKSEENRQEAYSADFGGHSPRPSTVPLPKSKHGSTFFFLALVPIIVSIVWISTDEKHEVPEANKANTRSVVVVPAPEETVQAPAVLEPTHAVAALNANLRSKPTSRSPIKAVLKRGDILTVISQQENFLEVRLLTGGVAFIAKELVIPIEDLSRLQKITGRDYVNDRISENRMASLINQANNDALKTSFGIAMFGLTNESEFVDNSLEKMQVAQNFDIKPDLPASIWFALSANLAVQSGNYENAFWEARAAIEADPANPEHHVAFGLINYQAENYEAVKAVGELLPKIAPTSTNAWMLFALSNALTPDSNDQLTKSAFVLAIKLSRNANNTKKYFREFAEKTSQPRIRELLNAALTRESEIPTLFAGVSRLGQVSQIKMP